MPVLTAAVVIVGILCVLNLLLLFGVIRRLREQTEMLNAARVPDAPIIGVGTGDAPASFTATTTSGRAVTDTSGLTMVAFFSSSCSICPERVPVFADYVREHRMSPDRVLAVVNGHESKPAPYLSTLEDVAQVCVEEDDGPLTKAFKVFGFPAFALLDADGKILAADFTPETLPDPVFAPTAR